MTENEYFQALTDVLHPQLRDGKRIVGGDIEVVESGQLPFALRTQGLGRHEAVKLEGMKGEWPCFRGKHVYAHRRCDRIVVTWHPLKSVPQFLLLELKSASTSGAHTQLGTSLAFCHFLHHMVCVGHNTPPQPEFAAVTVSATPFALKLSSTPVLPKWSPQGISPDCKHMHFPRSRGALPIQAVLAQV